MKSKDSFCQLEIMSEGTQELSVLEYVLLRMRKKYNYITGKIYIVLRDPTRLIDRLKLIAHPKRKIRKKLVVNTQFRPKILNLQPGEKVRIKPFEEIESSLDEAGRFEGLGFMKPAMKKYCGGIYTVKKRINLFFDERYRKFFKLQNVVILNDVFCESSSSDPQDWGGCDRCCFLFWKEAWLERIEEK